MVSFNAAKHYLFLKKPYFQNLTLLLIYAARIYGHFCLDRRILDSDIIILEMDQDAECVSTNRPGTVMIDSNTFSVFHVIIKLLQGKLSNITTI